MALAALPASAAEPPADAPWWDASWPFRQRVRVRLPAVQPFPFTYIPPQVLGEDLVAAEALLRCGPPAGKAAAGSDIRVVDSGGNPLPALVDGPDAKGLMHVTFPARRTIAGQLAEPIGAATATVRLTVGRDKAVAVGTRFFALRGPDRVALQVDSVAAKTSAARILEKPAASLPANSPVRSEDLTEADYFIYYGNPAPQGESQTWRPAVAPVSEFIWRLAGEAPPMSVPQLQAALRAGPEYVGMDTATQINTRAVRPAPLTFDAESNYIVAYDSYVYAPVAGLYRFSLDTDGAAFLFLDGRFTAQRTTALQHRTRQWEHRGKIQLDAGYHLLTLFIGEGAKAPINRLGWQPISAKVYDLVPPSFFVNRIGAEILGLEARDVRAQTFFTHRAAPRAVIDTTNPRLSVDQVAKWPDLAAKGVRSAQTGAASPAARLRELLQPDLLKLFEGGAKAKGLDIPIPPPAVDALNDILKNPDLYVKKDFQGVSIPGEALELLRSPRETLSPAAVLRLNRLLLAAAFPIEVAQGKRYQFVQFRNLTTIRSPDNAEPVTCQWDFGDGEQSRDLDPGHLFVVPHSGSADFPVTLRTFVGDHPAGEYQARVYCDPTPPEKLDLAYDVVSFANIVYADERTSIAVRVRNPGFSPVILSAVGRLTSRDGAQTLLKRSLTVPAQDEDFCILPVDLKQIEDKRASLQLDFFLGSERVKAIAARIVPSPQEIDSFHAELGALYDAEGRRIMICTEIENADRHLQWVFFRYFRNEVIYPRTKALRHVLLFGDPMANRVPAGQTFTDYVAILKDDLSKDGRSLSFVARSPDLFPALADLVLFAKTLPAADPKPDIVIISPGLADVEQGVDPRDFARSIDVLVDLLRASGRRIKPVVVSPPPYPANPRLSEHYTRAVRAVATDHHIPFLDLDALLRQGADDWAKAAFAVPDAEGILHPNPNEAAHRRIAEALLKLIY